MVERGHEQNGFVGAKGEGMERAQEVSDGKRVVSADALRGGQLYVFTEHESGGHLHQIRRTDDELPRLPITEEALASLRAFCRQMGKQLGGYRPDLPLAASALMMWAVRQPDAPGILREFVIAKFLQADEEQEDASTESAKEDRTDVET